MDMVKPFGFKLFGQPATKKNSSEICKQRIKGTDRFRHLIVPSKKYREWENNCRVQLMELKKQGLLPHFTTAVNLQCVYYLKNKAHFPDLNNLNAAIADIISDEYAMLENTLTGKKKRVLKRSWLLSNDTIIRTMDGSVIKGIDKNNPRVEIIITPLPVELQTEINPYIIRQIKEQTETVLFE